MPDPIRRPPAPSQHLRYELRTAGRLLRHPALWAVVGLTLLGAVAAFQVRHAYTVDVGSAADGGYVRNFHDRRVEADDGRTWRWSDAYSYLTLPGTGGGVPFTLTLTLDPGRAAVPVTIIVNGVPLAQQTLREGWQTLVIGVGEDRPQALAARDLVVELRAPPAPDSDVPGETHGLRVDSLTVSPAGPGFVQPALGVLAGLVALVMLVYLLLGRVVAPLPERDAARPAWPLRSLPLLGAALVGAAGVAALAGGSVPLVVGAQQVAGLGLGTWAMMIVLLLGVEWLGRHITPAAPWAARMLAVGVALAFVVRFLPMAWPGTVIIDLPWHLKWLHELLAGHWQALYFPGDLSSVPREWGLSILIPKSPLFYFLAAPLALLPWDLALSVKGLACLLEVSQMVVCYGLLARLAPGWGGARAGLLAAGVYALTPLGYRALAYGILPTILAQSLTTLGFVVLLLWLQRRAAGHAGRGWLAGFAILLTLSLLAFPTIAVFNTLVLGLLALAWLRRPATRQQGWTVGGLLALAWAIAILVYYGQYIPIILATTLPALLGGSPVGGGGTPSAAPTVHWQGPLDLVGWTLGFITSALPMLTGVAGLTLLWTGGPRPFPTPAPSRPLIALTLAWTSILGIFFLVNYRVDMIGKHLLYTMVPLALGAGLFLWQLGRRGAAARLWVALLWGALAWTALAFWLQRLVQASS